MYKMNKALYRLGIKGDIEVLYAFFAKSNDILGWGKRVVGKGLSETDFLSPKIKLGRRIFNSRKEKFQKIHLIEHVDRKIKRHKNYYTITPLGVSYLFKNHELGEASLKRIFDYIITNTNDDNDDYILKSIKNEALSKRRKRKLLEIWNDVKLKLVAIDAMKKACSGIVIKKEGSEPKVYFSILLERDIFIPLYSFTLKEKSVLMNFDPAGKSKEILTYEEFFSMVIETILENFWFELVRNGPEEEIYELLHDTGVYKEEIIEYFTYQLHDVLESSISGSTFDESKLSPKSLRLFR